MESSLILLPSLLCSLLCEDSPLIYPIDLINSCNLGGKYPHVPLNVLNKHFSYNDSYNERRYEMNTMDVHMSYLKHKQKNRSTFYQNVLEELVEFVQNEDDEQFSNEWDEIFLLPLLNRISKEHH